MFDKNVEQGTDLILPKARSKEIVVQESNNETLVYDLENEKAHHLNETVSIVWNHCDGKTNTNEMQLILNEHLNKNIENDFIWVALNELEKANLLEEKVSKENYTKLSRRKVLFNYALPTVAIPLVMSLVVPAQNLLARSCLPNESNCNPATTLPCCNGLFCNDLAGQCEPIINA